MGGDPTSSEILSRIIGWAKRQEPVRALILEGSRAGSDEADDLSDYDVNIFVTDPRPYVDDDDWLRSIDDVWVYVPAEIVHQGATYPTRLVIFKNGVKVDFILYSASVLAEFAGGRSLPDQYDMGYRVLLDKDGVTNGMPAPSFRGFLGGEPTALEFTECANVFWFEAYHVAKYLARGDLWAVKFRDWNLKSRLIQMIRWHESGKRGWGHRTHPHGKGMRSWVGTETWNALHRCFGRFYSEDGWAALFETFALFSRIGRETAETLGCGYPTDVEAKVVSFARKLRSP